MKYNRIGLIFEEREIIDAIKKSVTARSNKVL